MWRIERWCKISEQGLIRQINVCKKQIEDLEEELGLIKKESDKLKEVEEETNKKIRMIKKEIDGLNEQLASLEKEDDTILQKKIFIPWF